MENDLWIPFFSFILIGRSKIQAEKTLLLSKGSLFNLDRLFRKLRMGDEGSKSRFCENKYVISKVTEKLNFRKDNYNNRVQIEGALQVIQAYDSNIVKQYETILKPRVDISRQNTLEYFMNVLVFSRQKVYLPCS